MSKGVLQSLLPPILVSAVRRRSLNQSCTNVSFRGDYATWEDAERVSSGYDNPKILECTLAATLKVKSGEAAYERDSVVFERMDYSFPLLAGLCRAIQSGRLSVLDFGGALGSSYFQCRKFLNAVDELRWSVVEQKAHVERGRDEVADSKLNFYESVEECIDNECPNLILMSGVLQYLPRPRETLYELLGYSIPHVIIDRTAFWESTRDRLTVETVPEWIYPATYPAWFFQEERLMSVCYEHGYQVVADFPALDCIPIPGGDSYYKGFILESVESTK